MYGLYIALSFLSSNDWIYVKIRVDNVANDVSDAELRMLFEVFGKVQSVQLNDRQNWAAVEMSSKSAGKDAIDGLNGQNLKGINLVVAEMKDGGPRRQSKPKRRIRNR